MPEEQFIDYVKIFARSGNGGGGSAHLLLNGKMVNKTANSRGISDIIYFASAAGE